MLKLLLTYLFLCAGLDVCEQFMDVNDMIRDEDLIVPRVHSHGNGMDHGYYLSQSSHRIQHLGANMVPHFISKRLSARELNLLKRKAKVNAKDHPKGWSEDDDFEAAHSQTSATPKGTGPDSLNSNKVFCKYSFPLKTNINLSNLIWWTNKEICYIPLQLLVRKKSPQKEKMFPFAMCSLFIMFISQWLWEFIYIFLSLTNALISLLPAY